MAVVDSRARIYRVEGVKGVRVVDASAFSFLPPGHPQSPICELPVSISTEWFEGYLLTAIDALAEKIADLVKNG